MRLILLLVVSLPVTLAACVQAPAPNPSARVPLAEKSHRERLLVLERPPIIAVQEPEEMPLAIRAADSMDTAALERRESSRRVGTDALPFLTQTEVGRRFLAAAAPRAIARGMPAEFCPAVATTAGPAAGTRGEVVGRALESCLNRLGPEHEGCGCRVMALDDVVTVPRDDTAYATGVTARLQVPGLGLDLLLVAEDAAGGAVLLRDLAGPVARLGHGEGDAVSVDFAESGRHFQGYSVPVGFRRGRLAERIYARDDAGHRLSLLIGFEPDELAGRAAAWLAWPERG